MTQLSRLSAGDWITVGARRWASLPCLVSADQTIRSFAEVDRRVGFLAQALLDRGVRRGDTVAILATDSADHVEVILACMKAGIVFCDLNFRLRAPELRNITGRAQPRAMFISPRYRDLATEILSDCEGALLCEIGEDGELDRWIESASQRIPDGLAANGEELVSIAFTSGTTGTPKGVMQSERMIRNIVYSGIREVRIQAGGLRYSGASLFHISGIGSVLYAIASGCGSVILPQFEPEPVLWWLQNGITGCTLIPTMISALMALPDVGNGDYSRLQSIMYGGAPMSPALVKETMKTFGCRLFNGFGAGTEAGGQTMLYPEDHDLALQGRPELLQSIGKPILGVDLRLCDDNLQDVPLGEIGEIVTRSETVMSGYLGQPELTARSIVDGWFRAGDMAYADADGYLYLAARKADMIIRGGENVYPVEIESTLADHPAVFEVAVVGLPDEHWGEIVGAAVVLRPGAAATEADLRSFCRDRLASYKTPEVILFFDALPKNANGKFDKRTIQAWAAEEIPKS